MRRGNSQTAEELLVGWAALPSLPQPPCGLVPDPGFLRSRGLCLRGHRLKYPAFL